MPCWASVFPRAAAQGNTSQLKSPPRRLPQRSNHHLRRHTNTSPWLGPIDHVTTPSGRFKPTRGSVHKPMAFRSLCRRLCNLNPCSLRRCNRSPYSLSPSFLLRSRLRRSRRFPNRRFPRRRFPNRRFLSQRRQRCLFAINRSYPPTIGFAQSTAPNLYAGLPSLKLWHKTGPTSSPQPIAPLNTGPETALARTSPSLPQLARKAPEESPRAGIARFSSTIFPTANSTSTPGTSRRLSGPQRPSLAVVSPNAMAAKSGCVITIHLET